MHSRHISGIFFNYQFSHVSIIEMIQHPPRIPSGSCDTRQMLYMIIKMKPSINVIEYYRGSDTVQDRFEILDTHWRRGNSWEGSEIPRVGLGDGAQFLIKLPHYPSDSC